MVPQPVKAVILLFPVLDQVDPKRDEEDARIAKEGQHPIDSTVVWIKQTVSPIFDVSTMHLTTGYR